MVSARASSRTHHGTFCSCLWRRGLYPISSPLLSRRIPSICHPSARQNTVARSLLAPMGLVQCTAEYLSHSRGAWRRTGHSVCQICKTAPFTALISSTCGKRSAARGSDHPRRLGCTCLRAEKIASKRRGHVTEQREFTTVVIARPTRRAISATLAAQAMRPTLPQCDSCGKQRKRATGKLRKFAPVARERIQLPWFTRGHYRSRSTSGVMT